MPTVPKKAERRKVSSGRTLTEDERADSGRGHMSFRPLHDKLEKLDEIAESMGLGERGRTEALSRLIDEAYERLPKKRR